MRHASFVESPMSRNGTHNIGIGQCLNKSVYAVLLLSKYHQWIETATVSWYLLIISRYLSCFIVILHLQRSNFGTPSPGSKKGSGCAWCPRILLIIGQLDIVPSQWSSWGCTWDQKWIVYACKNIYIHVIIIYHSYICMMYVHITIVVRFTSQLLGVNLRYFHHGYPQKRQLHPVIFCKAGRSSQYGGSTNGGTPIAGWFTRENPVKMDDLGIPIF